jgi:5,5'-dehydrodivanillate O-demethylase oxygenase subunit
MVAVQNETTNGHGSTEYREHSRVGPGTLAGQYLRRFWHPVYRAQDLLPGHAKPLRLMGEDFTLYRGEGGTPHVVAFRCAHRGTQLSTGWVEDDCLRCFYHGWKYDASGQCVEMPAEDPSFPPKVQIASYPVREYLGLIFAYVGDGEPPPLPRFPELEDEGLAVVHHYTWPCSYFNSYENVCDPLHIGFVHSQSVFTQNSLVGIPETRGEETDYGVVVHAVRPGGKTRTTHLLMPTAQYFKQAPYEPEETEWSDIVSWRTPVDDERFTHFSVNVLRVTGEAAERIRERRAELAARSVEPRVLGAAVLRGELRVQVVTGPTNLVQVQDYVAQVGQGAIPARQSDRLGRSDVLVILLRKIWERELRALAEGRPLKAWERSERLVATAGA